MRQPGVCYDHGVQYYLLYRDYEVYWPPLPHDYEVLSCCNQCYRVNEVIGYYLNDRDHEVRWNRYLIEYPTHVQSTALSLSLIHI